MKAIVRKLIRNYYKLLYPKRILKLDKYKPETLIFLHEYYFEVGYLHTYLGNGLFLKTIIN